MENSENMIETLKENNKEEVIADEKKVIKENGHIGADEKEAVKAAENGHAVVDEKKPVNATENGHVAADEKGPAKEAEDENKEEDEEEESSDEELVGLFDGPVQILETKRERKSTEHFKLSEEDPAAKKVDDFDYEKGTGTKLSEMPYVKWKLDNTSSEDLVTTHKLLFGSRPMGKKQSMVKRNIRSFCGFPFDKEHKEYTKRLNLLQRYNKLGLRFACDLFALPRKVDDKELTDDEIRESIITWCLCPKDMEKPIPEKPKSKAKKVSKKRKSSEKKTKKVSTGGVTTEEEGSPKKKASESKKKPTTVKIAAPGKKKTPKKEGKSPKTPKSDSKRKASAVSDSEDEPLVKKSKKEPTDDEVRALVKNILKNADLEQVTMKTVCKQVYDNYPDVDMTPRKDFIKDTVKEIIS